MNIDFTPTELQFLIDILEEHRHQLQVEIIHTDHKEFKTRLREKEKMLDALMNKLALSVSTVP